MADDCVSFRPSRIAASERPTPRGGHRPLEFSLFESAAHPSDRAAAGKFASVSSVTIADESGLDVWLMAALRKVRDGQRVRRQRSGWQGVELLLRGLGVSNERSEMRHQRRGRRLVTEKAVNLETDRGLVHLKHLLAGALSAVVSRSCVAPIERVRMDILLNNSSLGPAGTAAQVYKLEGVPGFWRGNGLNVLRTAPFKALNFFSYDLYSKTFLRLTHNDGSGKLERVLAGACAGATSVITCFPLDTLRTRLLAASGKSYRGFGHALISMIRQEGVGSLYQGCFPALMSIAPSSAVFYSVYDLLKQSYLAQHKDVKELRCSGGLQLGVWRTLLYGAIAGAAAEIAVYPLEVIRRQMQLQRRAGALIAVGGGSQAMSVAGWELMVLVSATIIKKQGVRGFYSGVQLSTAQALPNAALNYFAYESFKAMLGVDRPECR